MDKLKKIWIIIKVFYRLHKKEFSLYYKLSWIFFLHGTIDIDKHDAVYDDIAEMIKDCITAEELINRRSL